MNQNYSFWENLVQKSKIVCFRWNLAINLFRMEMFTFLVLDWKYLFCANLVRYIKILCILWNLVLTQIQTCWIWCWCSNFLFRTAKTFFEQIWYKRIKSYDKNETWWLDYLKLCWIPWCSFFLFWTRNTYFGQIWSKNSNFLFKMKFGPETNLNMLNSKMMLKFSLEDQKDPFWVNLVRKG